MKPAPAICVNSHPSPTSSAPTLRYLSTSPHLRRRQRLHHTRALLEPGAENPIGILEHAILQAHDDELRPAEPGFDQPADVLGVGQVERSVDFVEDVHGRGGVLQQGEDEGEGDEGSVFVFSGYSFLSEVEVGTGREKMMGEVWEGD